MSGVVLLVYLALVVGVALAAGVAAWREVTGVVTWRAAAWREARRAPRTPEWASRAPELIRVESRWFCKVAVPLDGYHFHNCRFDHCTLTTRWGTNQLTSCALDDGTMISPSMESDSPRPLPPSCDLNHGELE